MKPQTLQLVLLAVLALALAGAVSSCRGSRKALTATTTELTNTSNKLAEANARLVELEAARKTLEVQVKMRQDDLGAASNRIAAVLEQSGDTAAELGKLRQELQSRDQMLAQTKTAQTRWTEERAALERVIRQRQEEIRAAGQEVATQRQRAEELRAELNKAENARAFLDQQLSDPATLRSRLAQAERPVGKAFPAERNAKVVINSDGTVELTR